MRIGIIGSGFSGIGAAVKLIADGFADVTIFERANEIGGTWRDNTYPGCACDIRSHLYSFSFFRNPNWTREFPGQAEIQRYLLDCVEHFQLRSRIQFDTLVTEVRLNETDGRWEITTSRGEVLSFDVVINGSGPLSRPKTPQLPGLATFRGKVFHSAEWDHQHRLEGERVAAIGTGASAIQFVPEIAPIVDHLAVFQRTPPWVMPRQDREFAAGERARFERFPVLSRAHRTGIYMRNELLGRAFRGGPRIIGYVRKEAAKYIASQVDDAALRATVTPSYAPGCKRILVSDDWYATLQRDNVELVTAAIDHVSETGIVTSDGAEHEADTIVFGTGFHATEFLAPMKIFGRNGVELSELWQNGAATHLGISMHGFPNFFLLVGPSTALGHNSIVFMIEAQMHYISGALRYMRAKNRRTVEVRAGVQSRSYARVQHRLQATVWASGCTSWYQSADGRNDTIWPSGTASYWIKTRWFNPRQTIVR